MKIIKGKDKGKEKILLSNYNDKVKTKDKKIYRILDIEFTTDEVCTLIYNEANKLNGNLFDRYELSENNTFKRRKINYGY
jgi:hypothetical protein